MATASKPENTAVATTDKKHRLLDLDDAKTEGRFIEAFGRGQLDKLKPEEQTMFLMAFGRKIGVRAELGELMIYQGKPYITINGRMRIAHESGRMGGAQPRPATSVERQQFGATDDEVLWCCEVWRIGHPRPYKGWGVVNKTTDRNPVAKQYPREMAKKRALYDALRMAFPPDENIGPLHEAFIAEAEAMATRQGQAMLAEPEDMPAVEGEEVAATETDEELLAQDREIAEREG